MKNLKTFLVLILVIILGAGCFSSVGCKVGNASSDVSSKSSIKNLANEISISQNAKEIFKYATDKGITGLTSYGETLSTLYIPPSINGIDTTFISANAFANKTMTTVYILPGITSIHDSAFLHCTNLKNVYIADTVVSLGANAFDTCSMLEEIVLGKNIERINKQAFFSCSKLKEIVIPKKVEVIGSKAFVGCKNLEKVIFENTTGWIAYKGSYTAEVDMSDAEAMAGFLKGYYSEWYWWRDR